MLFAHTEEYKGRVIVVFAYTKDDYMGTFLRSGVESGFIARGKDLDVVIDDVKLRVSEEPDLPDYYKLKENAAYWRGVSSGFKTAIDMISKTKS